ncbi:MAG: DUF4136 domain-containing protein [Usitatibacter sp.]
MRIASSTSRPRPRFSPMRLAGAGFLALAACSTGPEVRVDYDHAAPFERYSTFAFASPLGTDKAGYQGAVSRYLTAAARSELEARGMRYDEAAPDLRVNFNGRLTEKLRVAPSAYPPGGYYAYRYGYYGTYPGYPWGETAVPYTEGTLNVDIVDVARKQLVWEGVVVGVVTERTLSDLQPSIDAAVKAAFSKYPRGGAAK